MRHDTQRSKVYNAELALQAGRRFESIDQIRQYVDRVVARGYVQRRFGSRAQRGVRVEPGRDGTAAYARYATIVMPKWAWNEKVVLHEMAHVLVGTEYEHNWQFCAGYLDLVRNVMGKDAHATLLASYRKLGVKHREPRKANFTEEQRAKFREQMRRVAQQREATRGTYYVRMTWPDGMQRYLYRAGARHHGAEYGSTMVSAEAATWVFPDQARKAARKVHTGNLRVEIVADDGGHFRVYEEVPHE